MKGEITYTSYLRVKRNDVLYYNFQLNIYVTEIENISIVNSNSRKLQFQVQLQRPINSLPVITATLVLWSTLIQCRLIMSSVFQIYYAHCVKIHSTGLNIRNKLQMITLFQLLWDSDISYGGVITIMWCYCRLAFLVHNIASIMDISLDFYIFMSM